MTAGCFKPVLNGYRVQMFDVFNCGVSIKVLNFPQSPKEILPIVDLLPGVSKFVLRLTPGLDGKWNLTLDITFLASKAPVSIDTLFAVLRSPTKVKLEAGDDSSRASINRAAFEGRVIK